MKALSIKHWSLQFVVEREVVVLDLGALIILVHLGQRISVLVKACRNTVPPDWEMLLDWTAKVGSVRCWLGDYIVECLARALPSWCLNSEESGEGESNWKSKVPPMSCALNNWAHKRESKSPANGGVDNELSWKFLKLPGIEFFHFENFEIGKVVVINVCQQVPVLCNWNSTGAWVFSVQVFKQSVALWIQLLLHKHYHLSLVLTCLSSLRQNGTHRFN